jgi:hypothetical protein
MEINHFDLKSTNFKQASYFFNVDPQHYMHAYAIPVYFLLL